MAQRTIISPLTSQGINPTYLSTIKGWEKIAISSTTNLKDYIPMMFKPANLTQKARSFTYPIYAGMDDAVSWDGTSEIDDAVMGYLWDATGTKATYAKGWTDTYEAGLWDLYGFNKNARIELRKSAFFKRQKVAADFFNNAFATTTWFDGVYFFSASHPLSQNYSSTLYNDNLVSGAQSVDVFLSAINKGISMTDPMGRPLPDQRPIRLYVYPTKVINAKRFLNIGMANEWGKTDLNRNPFGDYQIEVVPYPYFSTSTKWMMQFTNYNTQYQDDVPITFLDPLPLVTHGVKQDITFTSIFFAEDYYGWVGGLGT